MQLLRRAAAGAKAPAAAGARWPPAAAAAGPALRLARAGASFGASTPASSSPEAARLLRRRPAAPRPLRSVGAGGGGGVVAFIREDPFHAGHLVRTARQFAELWYRSAARARACAGRHPLSSGDGAPLAAIPEASSPPPAAIAADLPPLAATGARRRAASQGPTPALLHDLDQLASDDVRFTAAGLLDREEGQARARALACKRPPA
jgi:hypothetical protein